jgi:hypothetical protein
MLEKVAQTVAKSKYCQSIIIKAKFESTQLLHQTTSKLLKYLQQTLIFHRNLPGPLKRCPNGKILPNLVTQISVQNVFHWLPKHA